MSVNERALKGVYKHFKGKYYLVTDTAISCDELETLVVYRPLNNPDLVYTRKLSEFLSDIDPDREGNVEHQEKRFKKVVDVNDLGALKSFTTEQLLTELGNRSDSPLAALDIKGLINKRVTYEDYIYAVVGEILDKNPKSPTYGKPVKYVSDWVSFSDLDSAIDYIKSSHNYNTRRKIYKRVLTEVD